MPRRARNDGGRGRAPEGAVIETDWLTFVRSRVIDPYTPTIDISTSCPWPLDHTSTGVLDLPNTAMAFLVRLRDSLSARGIRLPICWILVPVADSLSIVDEPSAVVTPPCEPRATTIDWESAHHAAPWSSSASRPVFKVDGKATEIQLAPWANPENAGGTATYAMPPTSSAWSVVPASGAR